MPGIMGASHGIAASIRINANKKYTNAFRNFASSGIPFLAIPLPSVIMVMAMIMAIG